MYIFRKHLILCIKAKFLVYNFRLFSWIIFKVIFNLKFKSMFLVWT